MGLGTGPVGVLPGARLLFIDNALAGANTIFVSPSTSNLFGGQLVFSNTASAGSATIQQRGSTLSNVNTAAETSFFDSSSAGTANFTNFGGKANNSAHGGVLRFRDNSTAATATINNRGAEVAGAYAGFTQFYESSTAGAARITNFGTASKTAFGAGNGGDLGFFRQANAGSATIVNQGATANGGSPGTTGFSERSSANQASITNAGGLAAAAPGGRTTFRGDVFSGASTAGGATILNGRGTVNGASGGLTQFLGTSTAGTSRVTNEGAKNSGGTQGRLDFKGTSNAGNASITNEGAGLANTLGGQTKFIEGTSAASATLMNLAGTVARAGGGAVNFESTIAGQTSTAGSATITNSGAAVIDALGGQTIFSAGSTAGGGTILNRGAQVANPTPIVGYNSGLTFFTNGGTAGAASFTNEGGTVGNALGGLASFSSGSSAGSASFLNKAATVQGGNGGGTQFFNATASTATFTNEGGRFFFGFGGLTEFRGAATAGAATLHNAAGQVSLGYGGSTSFIDTSTAGAATITNDGSAVSGGLGARTTFGGSAQAGTSAILNRAGTVSGALGGSTIFSDNARAGQSVIHSQGATVAGAAPGSVFFVNSSTAGGATLYADAGVGAAGGSLIFSDTSEGGTARAIIGGGGGASPGGLDISQLTDGSMFIGSIEGGGIVSLGRKGLAIGTNNLTTTFDGVIRDGGVVNQTGGFINKIGTGALTLNGDNTFTGLTYILRGLLRVNGSLAGGAYVQFATLGGNGTIAGGVTVGPGGIVNPGASPGTLTVVGDYLQQAGGALQLEIGGLNPADSDHLIATGKLTLGGILELDFINGFAPQAGDVFNLLTFGTLAGQFSGVELVGIAQGWQFTLDPAGTALGLTSLSNAVSVPEFLVRPGPNIVLSGGGQIAPGVPVHFLGGTLEAASDAVLDNPVIVGLAGAIFQSDAGTDSTLSGVLSGPGALTKTGPGALTLPAANTFTGDTFIADGSLFVDGSLASPNVFVLAAGLLGGNGTLLGNVFNSGIVSPGHSPGTLHIGGNFTQSPAGTLRIEVGGLAAGQSDRLTIGGHASLDGTVQFIRLDNFTLRRGDRLEFLTAAQGVSGKFATVLNSFATGTILEPRVTYGPTSVALEMVQGSFAEFAGRTGLAPNQRAVAQTLDSAAYDPRAEQLIAYLDARVLEKLPGDFDLLAPEELASIFTIGTSLAQVHAVNLQRRMADLRGGANGLSAARLSISDGMPDFSGSFGMAGPRGHESNELNAILAPAPDNRWGVFVSGVGEWVNVGDTRDARGYDFTTGGITLGIDYKVSANFAVGLSAGYTGTSADLANDGRVGVTGGKLGLYATAFAGGFYADVAVTGGYNSYDTHRTALQGTARGSTSGADLNVLFGAGYDWKRGGLTIGPTATFNYTYVGLDGFTESGSLAPLAIQDRHGESLRSAFGIRVSYDWKVRDGLIIRPEIRAAWQHEFGDASYDVSARFANGAGNVFTVNGPRIGRDSALLGAGITVQWNARCSTYLSYDGQIGRANYDSHSISGGMRIAF